MPKKCIYRLLQIVSNPFKKGNYSHTKYSLYNDKRKIKTCEFDVEFQ